MHDRTPGLAVVLSGPSGAGKTTVYRELLRERPEIQFSISCTTRSPRPKEVDGKDYFFLAREEFERRVRAGEFLEYADVHGNLYGTLRCEVASRVLAGGIVVLDIDVQGARLVREALRGTALESRTAYVFFAPPSLAELERRLRGRGTDAEGDIATRLANARAELAAWREYDYLVINDVVAAAVARLQAVVDAARCRVKSYPEGYWLDACAECRLP